MFGARHKSDTRGLSSSSPGAFHCFVLDAELVGLFAALSIITLGQFPTYIGNVCVMQFAVRCVPLPQSKVTHTTYCNCAGHHAFFGLAFTGRVTVLT